MVFHDFVSFAASNVVVVVIVFFIFFFVVVALLFLPINGLQPIVVLEVLQITDFR
jgi:hypothetical protein